jgi:transcription elongation factor GreB
MGIRERSRPDTSKKPGYITAEGFRCLQEEADFLWNHKRPEVTAAVSTAAAEGDRSENAEYIYRKRQLAEIDRRLRFLGNRLEALKVVTEKPQNDGRVYFGCRVTIEDEDGNRACYRIVGPDEWDSTRGEISVESPMAKALLGKHVDDDVEVQRPDGPACFLITKVAVDPG